MTDMPEKPRTVEVRQFQEIAYQPKTIDQEWDEGKTGPKGLDIGNGIVRHLEVPEHWHKHYGPKRDLDGCRRDDADLEIDFWPTAVPIGSGRHSAQFREMMSAPPHKLASEDIEWLQEMLNKQEPMAEGMTSAQTYDIDGRRVLETTGLSLDKRTAYVHIYVVLPRHESYLQKLIYMGKPEPIQKYKAEADQIFRSIQWLDKLGPEF